MASEMLVHGGETALQECPADHHSRAGLVANVQAIQGEHVQPATDISLLRLRFRPYSISLSNSAFMKTYEATIRIQVQGAPAYNLGLTQ
eukprot:6463969-Amphidinium_carterae.1